MSNTHEEKQLTGRPYGCSSLFDERKDAVLESIGHRIPYAVAAEANGIGEETLYGWIRKGFSDIRAGRKTGYASFSEALKKIEQKRIKEHLDVISERPERWQADAWILERRWWKHFSPQAALIEMNKRLDAMDCRNESEDSDEA